MSTNDWFNMLTKAKKSCFTQGNLKRVRYELENGDEMVEEYNLDTCVLTRRAWRRKVNVKAENEWDVEIGDPEPSFVKGDNFFIKENSNQPFITRRITKTYLEWRIRNLPYPEHVYAVTGDVADGCLVVRTTNRKYFKKIDIPELKRAQAQLQQEAIKFTHKYNTLIITYKKPTEVLNLENAIFEMVKKVKSQNETGDMGCNPS